MSSFYRSDVSRSNRDSRGTARAAASAIGRLADTKQATQLSAVIGNRAQGSSQQINGHVADKVNSYNIGYVIISCHCEVAKAVAGMGSACSPPASAPVQLRLPGPVNHFIRSNSVDRAEIASLLKAKQNFAVVSKKTGKPHTICVVFPKNVQDDFIASEVVSRLGLATQLSAASMKLLTWDSKWLSSTGCFVDLSIPVPGSDGNMVRRFYVVKDCPFDMLLGGAEAPKCVLPASSKPWCPSAVARQR